MSLMQSFYIYDYFNGFLKEKVKVKHLGFNVIIVTVKETVFPGLPLQEEHLFFFASFFYDGPFG
jgi:hypothetical protein